MGGTRVFVQCDECPFEEVYDGLGEARTALADHEAESGHTVEWIIERISSGVERAGADAGICGRPECTEDDSPFVRDLEEP